MPPPPAPPQTPGATETAPQRQPRLERQRQAALRALIGPLLFSKSGPRRVASCCLSNKMRSKRRQRRVWWVKRRDVNHTKRKMSSTGSFVPVVSKKKTLYQEYFTTPRLRLEATDSGKCDRHLIVIFFPDLD